MPGIGHVMMGLAAGRLQARRRQELVGSMILFAMIGLAPDLDAIAFAMRIPYDAPFGHRGAIHSLCMALIMAVGLAALAKVLKLGFWRFLAVAFATIALHDLADAATDGGLGIALFWPFSNQRIFLPWRPLPVAPIGLMGLVTPKGLHVALVELLVFSPCLAYAFWPRRQPSQKVPVTRAEADPGPPDT